MLVQAADGAELELTQLSDGYRSILCLGLEILRLMLLSYGRAVFLRHLNDEAGSVELPGVVAIDEVEAHLHPPWQKAVGTWLQKCYPQVQFIVSTHNPIVCRGLAQDDCIRGSVWELSLPGAEVGLRRIVGQDLNRLVYGDLIEAVGTEAFGADVGRSEEAGLLIDRLATLNRMSLRAELSDGGRSELTKLRGIFPTQSATTAP